jgi:hypothetical protein
VGPSVSFPRRGPKRITDNVNEFFQGHNFFHPQPPRPTPPSVYFLRLVAHNWSDKYLSILLRNLRDASGPGTHLLIQDSVLLNACRLPETLGKDSLPEIRGVPILDPPSPLLPNLGVLTPYQSDLSVSPFSPILSFFLRPKRETHFSNVHATDDEHPKRSGTNPSRVQVSSRTKWVDDEVRTSLCSCRTSARGFHAGVIIRHESGIVQMRTGVYNIYQSIETLMGLRMERSRAPFLRMLPVQDLGGSGVHSFVKLGKLMTTRMVRKRGAGSGGTESPFSVCM